MEEIDYSVIIPAYNEQELLPSTLVSLRESMESIAEDFSGEIILVDNNSTDDTASIARSFACRVVFAEHNQISYARNRGAEASLARFLVFLDADTLLPAELLLSALKELDSGTSCGGGALVDFDGSLPFAVRCFAGIWNACAVRAKLAAGCFIFCLRDAFDDCGGFSEELYASEEILFSKKVSKWGRVRNMYFKVFDNVRVTTSRRKMLWHSSFAILGSLIFLTLMPWATRSKSLCYLWYKRPE